MISTSESLWTLPEGVHCELVKFSDNLPQNYKIRLLELGFHPGERLQCLNSPNLGAPKIYRVSNTVYALDESIASQLIIKIV